jgi:hypothetical protein
MNALQESPNDGSKNKYSNMTNKSPVTDHHSINN